MNNYIFNIHLDEDIIAESIIAASRFIAEQIAVEMYPECVDKIFIIKYHMYSVVTTVEKILNCCKIVVRMQKKTS